MYYLRFIRKDHQPDEEYFYQRECDAMSHFELFENDDSNLYKEIQLLYQEKVNKPECILRSSLS